MDDVCVVSEFHEGPPDHTIRFPGSRITRHQPLAGLVFDVSGVLYDDSAWHRWLLQLLARMGLHTNYTAFFRVFECEFLRVAGGETRDYWEALSLYLSTIGFSAAQINEVKAAGRARRRQLHENLRPLPSVKSTLVALRDRGVPLGVRCSSPLPAATLQQRLDSIELAGLFDVVAGIDQVPRKRGSHPWRAFSEGWRVATAEIGFVSCDPIALTDAAEDGLYAIGLNAARGVRADFYAEQLVELLTGFEYRTLRALAG